MSQLQNIIAVKCHGKRIFTQLNVKAVKFILHPATSFPQTQLCKPVATLSYGKCPDELPILQFNQFRYLQPGHTMTLQQYGNTIISRSSQMQEERFTQHFPKNFYFREHLTLELFKSKVNRYSIFLFLFIFISYNLISFISHTSLSLRFSVFSGS